MRRAEALRRAGNLAEAAEIYREALEVEETPSPQLCLKAARCVANAGDCQSAYRCLARVVDVSTAFVDWSSAASMLRDITAEERPEGLRRVRGALAGTYTTAQLAAMLPLAALRAGIDLELYESGFNQYRQDLIDERSALYDFEPGVVIIAPHEGALELPDFSHCPEVDVEAELERWRSLWRVAESRAGAEVIQHNFALRPEVALGHLATRVAGSRHAMATALNARLGEAAGNDVSIVDCERIASSFGKDRWFDDRYWHLAKQAVALDAVPLLARHTTAVLAARIGAGRKCLVLDLDGTLWGGIVGEDGLGGIELGTGPRGEAYQAFQDYILELKAKGIILAVVSKNNEADALEVFERHPDMKIRLDDIAFFAANWDEKTSNLLTTAETLNIGLDSIVFVDDNPAERQLVRRMLPEVDVVTLPAEPAEYRRALARYLLLETATLTKDDRRRTDQYRARAELDRARQAAPTLEDFYRSLDMQAVVAPFDDFHLPRIAQLLGKTNQFNLTTKRHGLPELRAFMANPDCVHLYLKLRDRFADHGLVSVVIALRRDGFLDIDSWCMSCRVIGRTVEDDLLNHLCRRAVALGCDRLRGTYIPTPKNQIAQDVYERFAFSLVDEQDGTTMWEYDIRAQGPIENEFIAPWEG
jgi:FkbH-like protein